MDNYPAADPIPDPSMAVDYETLMDFLSTSKEMKQTATSSLKQALWAGSAAMAGGMAFGPVGGLVGGITGSLIGFMNSSNYDGVMVHLHKLDESSKKELLTKVRQVLVVAAAGAGAGKGDFACVESFRDKLLIYASQPSVRENLWNACVESLQI
mmetsp:Transcript_40357/g.40921  ORF Transcript_40357/g.40921 Transcript_40357/m.40921 type:complete len:154 (-) Transcript_40357:96-557(-)